MVLRNPHAWNGVNRAHLDQTDEAPRAVRRAQRDEENPMSVIPEESGRETTDLPDNGLGFMMIVLLALAVVTALFT